MWYGRPVAAQCCDRVVAAACHAHAPRKNSLARSCRPAPRSYAGCTTGRAAPAPGPLPWPQADPNWDARPIRAQNLCTAHSPEKRWSPGTAPRTLLCPYASGPWQSCMAGQRPPLPPTKKPHRATRMHAAGARAPSAQLEPRARNLAALRSAPCKAAKSAAPLQRWQRAPAQAAWPLRWPAPR